MWRIVEKLRASGVTIILTTHYIEEAEEIADRVGVINNGELLLIDEKDSLMRKLGKKQLQVELREAISEVPEALQSFQLQLLDDGRSLMYTYDTRGERTGITSLLQAVSASGLQLQDLHSHQSTLEEIFVELVSDDPVSEAS